MLALLPLLALAAPAADPAPALKFNDVKEVAPGVFFRYSAISPTDSSIFGGSNNIWVVFDEYVVVIDANFPKEAGDVLAAIKKTTDKPVRYVLDTHHHGDHAWGNAVWAKAGATVVSSALCAAEMRRTGPKDFADAGRGPTARKDVAASTLKTPTLVFDDKLVLDDGKQRVEFLRLGHAHTIGDAVAWLPKHGILCTGDACVNGAFNYMGHSDSASWVRTLERMEALGPKLVLPGHGLPEGPALVARQKRYFVELRQAVRAGLAAGKDLGEIQKTFKPAWYKEWTQVDPAAANVQHVYDELTGRVPPANVAEEFDLVEGAKAPKDADGWAKPKRLVVPAGLMAGRLAELKRLAPDLEFVPVKDAEEAAREAGTADGVLGFATAGVLKANPRLRWVQAGPEGVSPEVVSVAPGGKVVVTAATRLGAVDVADRTLALLLRLTKGSPLQGRTLLVVGLGSTGRQIARRASAFGMRVEAVDPRDIERPGMVARLDKLDRLAERLAVADVVALALPLREDTRGVLGAKELKALKPTALVVSAAHPGLIDLDALAEAVAGKKLAGAGLDTSEAGPLPEGHPLRKLPAVALAAEGARPSAGAQERLWRLWRENVRRFVAGEAPLGVVE